MQVVIILNTNSCLDLISILKNAGTPDLFFSNEVTSFIHNTFKTNSYKRVFPSGKIVWSTRLTVTLGCPMDLRYFPFDRQVQKQLSHTN
jgi:hypothetical protein